MCIEIENYKQNNLFNYFDYNQLDTDTEDLINTLLNNPEYNLKLNKRRVPVMEIAKVLGLISTLQNSMITISKQQ